jgi:hypothetical protein
MGMQIEFGGTVEKKQITQEAINRRLFWVGEIKKLSGNFGADSVRQRLLDNPEAASGPRNTLPGLHQTNCFLLELKRVCLPRYLHHLRLPFAV